MQAQIAQNTVTAGPYNFVVKNSNRPFSNDFVLISAKVIKFRGRDEVQCIVQCTANSNEPGRVYFAQYSTKGKLQVCNSIN